MPFVHLRPRQFEMLCRPLAREMIPSVGEEYFANIHEQRLNWECPLHLTSGKLLGETVRAMLHPTAWPKGFARFNRRREKE